jgi:hypothetical protein
MIDTRRPELDILDAFAGCRVAPASPGLARLAEDLGRAVQTADAGERVQLHVAALRRLEAWLVAELRRLAGRDRHRDTDALLEVLTVAQLERERRDGHDQVLVDAARAPTRDLSRAWMDVPSGSTVCAPSPLRPCAGPGVDESRDGPAAAASDSAPRRGGR